MRGAYAFLGILIMIVIFGALILIFSGTPQEEIQVDEVITPQEDVTIEETAMHDLVLTSSVFEPNGSIPSKYSCDAENIIPPLAIVGVPEEAQSLVLLMDDPDIPESVKKARGIEVFDHWVVFNISPDTNTISEGEEPEGISGVNSTGETGYTGPCPPDREHRYFFKLFALDTMLDLDETAAKADVETAMEGHVLAETELVGHYERQPDATTE